MNGLYFDFFTLPREAQTGMIEVCASAMKVDPIIIEKDLWVVLTLHALFDRIHEYNAHKALTFKGGTSLSKAYQAIERFSEDIDITIDRKFLGLQVSDVELKTFSRKKRDGILEELKEKGHKFIEIHILSYLKARLTGFFPNEVIEIKFKSEDFLSLEIFYPSRLQSAYNSYIKHKIDVEFGVRGDPYPTETTNVRPYLHEKIKQLNDLCIPVNVLLPIRTFFEKVTLLHAETHAAGIKERLSRHYYDLHQLVQKGYLNEAKTQLEILKNVIEHKSVFFASKKASYETIYTNGLCLLPPTEKLHEIQTDYQEMGLMIFGKHPSFEEIISSIKEIELSLNSEILNG